MLTQSEKRRTLFFAIVVVSCTVCTTPRERPYLERRAQFRTKLLSPSPAPLDADPEAERPWAPSYSNWKMPPDGLREVSYRSGGLELKAWVYEPPGVGAALAPALVYLHPGVGAAGSSWIGDTKPFVEAGFVVMLPTFRGEMGNPGHFEFALGEVDDAKAAIVWLGEQPFVDRTRIYAFGWSYGGFLSAMLSLLDDVPLRHSGSIGGLLSPGLFNDFEAGALPFDRSNVEENELRSLVGNIRWMKRKHYAYMGSADSFYVPAIVAAKHEMARGASLLEIVMVPGEHFGSALPGIALYFDLIEREQRK